MIIPAKQVCQTVNKQPTHSLKERESKLEVSIKFPPFSKPKESHGRGGRKILRVRGDGRLRPLEDTMWTRYIWAQGDWSSKHRASVISHGLEVLRGCPQGHPRHHPYGALAVIVAAASGAVCYLLLCAGSRLCSRAFPTVPCMVVGKHKN